MSHPALNRVRAVGLFVGLACLVWGAAAPAAAVTADAGPARLAYRCTVAATDLGTTIRVVYRLSSDGPHERWRVQMWSRGRRFLARTVRTDEMGHLRVSAVAVDYVGRDEIRASGRRLDEGPTCRVSLKA